MLIEITLDSTRAMAQIDSQYAPSTCSAVANLLPFSGIAHYAKIAGQEFMVHIPLVTDIERARPVSQLSPGAVVFWPERQLFCVYYGQIQEEDAEVTLLGQVVENLDGLMAAGEDLRTTQGRRFTRVRLALEEGSPNQTPAQSRHPSADPSALQARVMAAFAADVDSLPREVESLVHRRGVMRPGGALLYAEAETRKLHEFLWLLRLALRQGDPVPGLVGDTLHHYARRLGGWYGLTEGSELTMATAIAVRSLPRPQAIEVVEAMVLYIGNLNMWLDAHIPWDEFNQLVRPENAPQPGRA